eukprot:gene3834-3883_t
MDAGKFQIQRSEISVISLLNNLCDLLKPLAKDKGLEFKCEIAKAVPDRIIADSLRLNQILTNIINNAIKFTNSGSIEVKLEVLQSSTEKAQLNFVVKDSGLGIPKSSINKIFQRFEQVEDKTWQNYGGNGLGLSIVKRLVELKGGQLNVESEIGVADVTKDDSNSARLNNIMVLLAEDNSASQYIIVEMLGKWNMSVDVASNGMEAFEKLKYHDYSLVLLDTHMPVLNGYETARKIRREMTGSKQNIPIISFSASVTESEKNAAITAGANDFINKPFEPEALRLMIAEKVNTEVTVTALILAGQPVVGPSDATSPAPTLASAVQKIIEDNGSISLTAPVVSGITYQWFKKDASGTMQLLVESNSSGCTSVGSDLFNVYVIPAWTASITASTASVCEQAHTTSVLSALPASSGIVTYTYQWTRNGAPIAGATGNTYTVSETTAGAVNYGVSVTSSLSKTVQTASQSITVTPLPAKPTIVASL